jgi:hypothetical protein
MVQTSDIGAFGFRVCRYATGSGGADSTEQNLAKRTEVLARWLFTYGSSAVRRTPGHVFALAGAGCCKRRGRLAGCMLVRASGRTFPVPPGATGNREIGNLDFHDPRPNNPSQLGFPGPLSAVPGPIEIKAKSRVFSGISTRGSLLCPVCRFRFVLHCVVSQRREQRLPVHKCSQWLDAASARPPSWGGLGKEGRRPVTGVGSDRRLQRTQPCGDVMGAVLRLVSVDLVESSNDLLKFTMAAKRTSRGC